MVTRGFWLKRVEEAWKRRSIIWLSGVRRAGKTLLCQSIPNCEYFDCELPRNRHLMEDVESFLSQYKTNRIVLDEIHRLQNPSEILKIAADHFPKLKIIATGSSTLGASAKFGDTLTGRKTEIWLTPIIEEERKLFGFTDLKHRFLFGGLPPFFMENKLPEKDYQEWIDAYWAKDIQELFRIERKYSFQKFTELLLAQSGSIFEATQFSTPCEVSRQTIMNYLSILEATFVVHVIKPFTTHKSTEIVSAPKVYGFDTGFICHTKGWLDLRKEDLGILWEHYVLNEIQAHLQTRKIFYWRDKQKHEIDFIFLKQRQQRPIVIECKWTADQFDPANLKIFRQKYPDGENFVVSQNVQKYYKKKFGEVYVTFIGLMDLIHHLSS